MKKKILKSASKEIKLTLSEYIIGRYVQKHALSMRALLVDIKK